MLNKHHTLNNLHTNRVDLYFTTTGKLFLGSDFSLLLRNDFFMHYRNQETENYSESCKKKVASI